MVDSATAVDILTEGHDVSRVAEFPIHRTSGVPDGGGVAFYYEGDLSDLDCGSVEDCERDTWDDWCDSAFCDGYGGFPSDADDTQPPVVFSDQLFWDDDIAEPPRMLPDSGYAPVSTSPIPAGTIMPLMLPDTDQTFRLDNSGLELLDSRFGEFSVLSLATGDTFCDMDDLEGDALCACARDVGILDSDEGWLCLLCSLRSGNSGDNSVAAGVNCQGLGHCRGIIWDPSPVGGQCLHVCCDCLCVIALFRNVMLLLVHDWAGFSAWTRTEIGYCRINTWEVGYLGSIYLPCDVDRFFGRDVWQIKGLEAVVMAGGDDVIRFLLCACERATSVGVVSPGMLLILVIGLLDCVGGPLGCLDWLNRLSWGAWLAGRPMSVHSAVAVFPGGVRIMYIRSELTGSPSLDTTPVTGSLHFYAPVCCLAGVGRWYFLYLACWTWIFFPASWYIFGYGGR